MKIFCDERFEAEKRLLWLERNLPVINSTLYKKLSSYKIELILYMMGVTKKKKVKKSISHYITRLRFINTSIKGKDLLNMGLEPGPIYREIFEAVLDEKLNDKIKTHNDELAFARKYAS
jgi:tRNA nucleotidyltransferase (CCA-adding enzyme)